MLHSIEEISGTKSQAERSASIKWLAEQGEAIQIEAFKYQTDLLRQRRGQKEKITPELVYALLVFVSRRMRSEEDALHMKRRLTDEKAGEITSRRIQRFKAAKKSKGSPKREIIRVKYYHLVQKLRTEENMGWRSCADYLKKYHDYTITFSYLKLIIQDLEKLTNGN